MAFIPFPCPFTVISQMESNDDKVPSMSKKYIFILFMHGKHSVRDVWTSQPFSRLLFRTFCALENQQTTQNKRRVPRLEGAQTYKLLCVVVESSNGQRWGLPLSLGSYPKLCEEKHIDNASSSSYSSHNRSSTTFGTQTSWSASS